MRHLICDASEVGAAVKSFRAYGLLPNKIDCIDKNGLYPTSPRQGAGWRVLEQGARNGQPLLLAAG